MTDRNDRNWDTGEVRLWIANEEPSYRAMQQCRTVTELRGTFMYMPGPRVDWDAVDWEWIFDQFEEDREEA